MAIIPPKLSAEERKAAGVKAVLARQERAAMKEALGAGTIGIFEVINDGRQSIQRMRVSELLDAAPGIGARRAFIIMAKAGISQTRRIGGLGSHQLRKLRSEMILNKVPVNQGALIVMSGPGGVGKSTITAHLRNHPAIWVSTSVTTREPRDNERDGHDYHFITEEKFDQLIAKMNSWNGPNLLALDTGLYEALLKMRAIWASTFSLRLKLQVLDKLDWPIPRRS